MPADHGTPNTGDERDREVEAVAAAYGREAFESGDARLAAAAAIDALDAVRAPSRDGTVAVEDVERLERIASALAVLVNFKDGPRDDAYDRDKPAAWQEAREALGWHASTSERTERIHDQATKEER